MPAATNAMRGGTLVQHAHKFDIRSQSAMPVVDTEAWDKEAPWPRHVRVMFMLGAATACWGAVALVGYWLVRWGIFQP